ncbi:MAG TPA: 2-oxoglutarate dehydrogenase E1 component [Terriglobales bacterium]|nr:2-oxoglutarate dehydrogenase E1 component [Terriglobales bacterium]
MAVQTETAEKQQIVDLFRRWGYLQADLDPMGFLRPEPLPELDVHGPEAEEARRYYCGTIGAEFMHLPQMERRQWIAERLEAGPPRLDRARILDRLVRADVFEQVLQARYLGTKRFSLEGITALIPLLETMLEGAAEGGAEQALLAMSHRGRLNVMWQIVGRAPADIFAGFEDVDPRSVLGGGDVKYHIGATGEYVARGGRKLHLHLVSNPSHLEAVDPVALGRARAKQTRIGHDGERQIVAIVLHGDAAFAGQGIWAETLNFSGLRGFSVGGALHVIVNNLIGFTTPPEELHTSRFASDLAKRQAVPIFHVNAEDPEAVVRVARIALEYRCEFLSDVVVDLIGFRRHGHSEVDDPTITQPLLYRKIKDHPPLSQRYATNLGADIGPIAESIRAELEEAQKAAAKMQKKPSLRTMPAYWSEFVGGRYKAEYDVDTGVPAEQLLSITQAITQAPPSFHLHPKVKRLLEQRAQMGRGQAPVDFGMTEALAFGSLLRQGVPVRISGQDTQRGTFNQRHAVLVDVENEEKYIPLDHVAPGQARFEIYNSELSEAAVLGFEYGYSRDYPETLTLWEAQFGDFSNGAQVIIDQFITAGEDKWDLLSGLVLLLPHGYEGQGPEHSSARIERFLQLAAKDNIQICQPSTAAQYFHLLRRQALHKWRKPLVVFTPKSMLRHPEAVSPLSDLGQPRFLTVLPDKDVERAQRLLVCTGKVGHELRMERKRRKDTSTAIVFLEQLYPFPETEISAELERHSDAEIVWVQEEPANMGALWYVVPRLRRVARGRPVLTVKRSASASPATGSAKAHELEQKTLLTLAFAKKSP